MLKYGTNCVNQEVWTKIARPLFHEFYKFTHQSIAHLRLYLKCCKSNSIEASVRTQIGSEMGDLPRSNGCTTSNCVRNAPTSEQLAARPARLGSAQSICREDQCDVQLSMPKSLTSEENLNNKSQNFKKWFNFNENSWPLGIHEKFNFIVKMIETINWP